MRASLAITGLVLVWVLANLVAQERAQPVEPLPMTFAHEDHTAGIVCMDCHHNYVDDTGHGLCIDCHRTDPEIAHLLEPMFHDLCRGCHVQTHLEGEPSGPQARMRAVPYGGVPTLTSYPQAPRHIAAHRCNRTCCAFARRTLLAGRVLAV